MLVTADGIVISNSPLQWLNRLSLMNLYYELVMGVLNPSGILVLLSVTAVFLFLTCVFLERLKKPGCFTVILFVAAVIAVNAFFAALTGRFSQARTMPRRSFARSNTWRDPSFLITMIGISSTLS